MPQLHSVIERNPVNVHDAIRVIGKHDIQAMKDGMLVLFQNANIGRPHLTNMQVAGQLVCDHTTVILNWYARTNIPITTESRRSLREAFAEFTAFTKVTLGIGQASPERDTTLSDLMVRTEGMRLGRSATDTHVESERDEFGRIAYEAYQRSITPWEHLSPESKAPWIRAADAVRYGPHAVNCHVVPPRATVNVRVDVGWHTLSKLLEVIPSTISPEPLIWVHLEGFSRRETS